MSGRCKACNSILSEEDMRRKFPIDVALTRDYSDLCGDCFEDSVAVVFDCYEEPTNDTLSVSYGMSRMSEEWE